MAAGSRDAGRNEAAHCTATIEHCCAMLQRAVDAEAVINQPKPQMRRRILNEIDSDYAVGSPEDRPSVFPSNFCPFCGRAISRTVWDAEEKK